MMRISTDGHVHANAYDTPAADVAEMFEAVASRELEPGDVLIIAPDRERTVERSTEAFSTLIAGVSATKPGLVLGEGIGSGGSGIPMGVIGVIPTKVSTENGPIAAGDLLVTSATPGHAMRADPADIGAGMLLGKALQPLSGTATGTIEVLVGVR